MQFEDIPIGKFDFIGHEGLTYIKIKPFQHENKEYDTIRENPLSLAIEYYSVGPQHKEVRSLER